MTIYDTINRVNDKAAQIESDIGHPHRIPMVVLGSLLDEETGQLSNTTLSVKPDPHITNVPLRDVGLQVGGERSGITISAGDRIALVSRSIPLTSLVPTDKRRIRVDLPTDNHGAAGRLWRIIHVSDRDCCHWRVTLRREGD